LGAGATDYQKGKLIMRIIRRAQATDAEAINSLYNELNTLSAPTVLPERIAAIANSEHTYLLVYDDGEDILATALLCLCQDVMFSNQPFALVKMWSSVPIINAKESAKA
jgi:hypothetical protein